MVTRLLSGAEILLKALEEQGVEHLFGYPGGAVLPIYDALFNRNQMRHILVRQEAGAVHAAEGYARSTGKPGVVLVTSGPGATNAVTGLTDALMDSIPLICISGQVPTHLIGNDAFQECDTVGITRPCTKHNYLVQDVNDLARVVHEAFYVATHGRPGPVLIDLPKDVAMALGTYRKCDSVKPAHYDPPTKPEGRAIAEAIELLKKAKRPIIYAGGGVINSGTEASKLLTQFARLSGIPVTLTLMGLGAFPASDKQFLGMLGMHGTYEANWAMHDCDFMLAVGSRFDDRITGNIAAFSPDSAKVHIDIDPASINKNVRVDLPIIADAGLALKALISRYKKAGISTGQRAYKPWWAQIRKWQAKNCLAYDTSSKSTIKPQHAVRRLYELTRKKSKVLITTEVGQHQMWAAQHFHFDKPNRWMTSGGLGTMGYGLPAAMGAQVAHPDALVVDIAGEASILMNIQEMGTLAQYRLPVKVFILNNQYMGMVRQWQELLHGGRYSESYMDSLPDFVRLAESFHGVGLRATHLDELDDVIEEMLAVDKHVIADIAVDPTENCFPMIPSGAAHNEMLLSADDTADNTVSKDGMVLV